MEEPCAMVRMHGSVRGASNRPYSIEFDKLRDNHFVKVSPLKHINLVIIYNNIIIIMGGEFNVLCLLYQLRYHWSSRP